jgi:gamma-glutamyltranspeptidase/glutathione hydrolase
MRYTFLLLFIISQFFSIIGRTPESFEKGMVVSASELASDVGLKILQEGGNAVDASVAVGFALAVTYPYAGNLGGGGFVVIHLSSGKNTSVDFREKAPISAHRDMYLDDNGKYLPELSQKGITSVGVPGSVAGLIYTLEKYGTMSLSEVIQPSIDLAANGWELDKYTAKSFEHYLTTFIQYPSSFKVFSKNGKPYEEGDNFVQTDLARTLTEIKNKGKDGFYKGWVADKIIEQVNELNGIITYEDLEKYTPVEREPVKGTYRGHGILSMGPPSSGGIALVQLLNILENFKFRSSDFGSSAYINKLVESMKYVYADRTYHLGDEDFYDVPKDKLTSKEYAFEIFKKLQQFAVPSDQITTQLPENYHESTETTHYSVYDQYGNAVSTTTTINSGFGSKIVVDGAGFLLNNEMDDFSAKPGEPNQFGLMGSVANSIQPEKRMLSAMSPTIVLKENEPYIILGSPGGSTIITVVLQVILNCIDFEMNITEAVHAPRIHHQWFPDVIYTEKFSVNKDAADKLNKMGYNLANRNDTFRILGCVQAIMIDKENNLIYGATDPRRTGSVKGH